MFDGNSTIRRNPAVSGWGLLGLAALIYGTYKILQTSKPSATPYRPTVEQDEWAFTCWSVSNGELVTPNRCRLPDGTEIDRPVSKPPKGEGNFVGSGWKGWPHKDLFPDETAFGRSLWEMGYEQAGADTWEEAMQGVSLFQSDYNKWKRAYDADPATGLQISPVAPTQAPVTVDGKIGTNTANAMERALRAHQQYPGGFQALLQRMG